MANRISSERKVKRKFGTSKCECFDGLLGDVLRTSWGRPEIRTSPGRHFRTSPERQIGMSTGWSNRIFRGRPGDVGRERPRDVLGSNICRLGSLQEVRCLHNNSVNITNKQKNVEQKCEFCWSGHAAKRQHGVGKVDKGIKIEEIIPVSARIIVANVLLYGCSQRVICCYVPTEENSDLSKNIFYCKLNKHFECENSQKIICLGDFNASL